MWLWDLEKATNTGARGSRHSNECPRRADRIWLEHSFLIRKDSTLYSRRER